MHRRLATLLPCTFLGVLLLSASLQAAVWHVDASKGDDAQDGTEDRPFRSIMHAAKLVNPGDTVLVHAGVYYEHVKLERVGTAAAPILFKAVDGPQQTIITGAHRPLREGALKWESIEDGLWRVALPEEPATLLCDDLNLYRFPSLAELRSGIVLAQLGVVRRNGLSPSAPFGQIRQNRSKHTHPESLPGSRSGLSWRRNRRTHSRQFPAQYSRPLARGA